MKNQKCICLLDLAYEVGLNPKKVSNTLGGEYHSACLRCGGKDRFVINPNRPMKNCYGSYWCRQCNIRGDAIQFCMDFLGLSFNEAKARVGATIMSNRTSLPSKSSVQFTPAELMSPPDKWLGRADLLVLFANQEIRHHQEVLQWLKKRGIDDIAITKYKIGWNNKDVFFDREDWGLMYEETEDGRPRKVWIPEGLVMPIIDFSNNSINRIKVRRKKWVNGDELPKYVEISGSRNGLSIIGDIRNNVMFVLESELDAIALECSIGEISFVVAVGGNTKNPDNLTDSLAKNKPLLFIAHDNDKSGVDMLKKWQSLYPHAKAMPTPVGKDIGEAIELGLNVNQWLIERLTSIRNTG